MSEGNVLCVGGVGVYVCLCMCVRGGGGGEGGHVYFCALTHKPWSIDHASIAHQEVVINIRLPPAHMGLPPSTTLTHQAWSV